MKRCLDCKYFDGPRSDGDMVDAGLCRFASPQSSVGLGWRDGKGKQRTMQRGMWPIVMGRHDWCGEHTEVTP
jgi:hypothetical protein